MGKGVGTRAQRAYPPPQASAPFPEGRAPWERLPGENDHAWRAFCEYRAQEPPRQARLHDDIDEVRIQWFNTFRWGERVALWDDHVHVLVQAEKGKFLKETVREIDAKHMAILADAKTVLVNEVRKMVLESKGSQLTTLKHRDVLKLLHETVVLDRLVRGESTSNDGALAVDLSELTPEELRSWQALMAKTKKKTEP